MAPNTPTTYKM